MQWRKWEQGEQKNIECEDFQDLIWGFGMGRESVSIFGKAGVWQSYEKVGSIRFKGWNFLSKSLATLDNDYMKASM